MTVREESAAGAMEVMSRFAVDPRWLVYLPPTMAPTATSQREGTLEHPAEAFAEFRAEGVGQVVCEEKHMGSRAIVVVCRDEETAQARFGADGTGAIYTRTGRPFLDDAEPALARIRAAATAAGLWERLETGWLVLDCEILPWSAKAQELIDRQYAPVGAAGTAALDASVAVLEQAAARGLDVGELLDRTRGRADARAPLQRPPTRATTGRSAASRTCGWRRSTCSPPSPARSPSATTPGTSSTATRSPPPTPTGSSAPTAASWTSRARTPTAIEWWETLTAGGGEGMVVKPLAFTTRGRKGLAQPGIKVRGREYLRIIYGPEYDAPDQIGRLRSRSLGRKRSMAWREFALGVEALERFVRGEPLYRVHECVFAVLALESEPVDPRL